MPTPFPFEPFLAFGALGLFILIGVVLRAKIRFFQNYLIPSCLIGGVIGLVLINLNLVPINVEQLETIAYHFFIISFISVGFLFIAEIVAMGNSKATSDINIKGILKGSFWLALMEGLTLPAQAIIGCLLFYVFTAFGVKLFPTFGLLLPLGFTEGPGQALAFGKVWEGFGFSHAATLGLTFAAVGFLFAFFIGVPLVNWGIRKTRGIGQTEELPQDLLKGLIPKEQEKEPTGQQTTHSSNIDTLAFHAALIGIVYLLTYAFIYLMGKLINAEAAKALWGFFFFFGMFIAMGVGGIMKKIGVAHYIDPGTQRRITGWAIDFLIIATIMAIQVVVVWQFIIPIVIMSVSAGLVTIIILVFFGRRLYGNNLERMVFIYGTCTGTVSSGLLLLRIVDPQLKSSVALEAGVMNILVAPIILACMILVNAFIWWKWEMWLVGLAFVGIMAICLILLKVLKYWGEPKF